MTEDEQQIAALQETLDDIADRIDRSIAENGEDDQAAFCWRLMHAQSSALLYLMKKGQTNVEYKDKLR